MSHNLNKQSLYENVFGVLLLKNKKTDVVFLMSIMVKNDLFCLKGPSHLWKMSKAFLK